MHYKLYRVGFQYLNKSGQEVSDSRKTMALTSDEAEAKVKAMLEGDEYYKTRDITGWESILHKDSGLGKY